VHTLPFSFSNLASFTKLGENFKFILSINKVSKTATHSTFVFVLVSSKTAYIYTSTCADGLWGFETLGQTLAQAQQLRVSTCSEAQLEHCT
jgi:hypothetical protein